MYIYIYIYILQANTGGGAGGGGPVQGGSRRSGGSGKVQLRCPTDLAPLVTVSPEGSITASQDGSALITFNSTGTLTIE